jgi:hypothetical protein
MTANRAASIRARLKQHTDTSKQDFNLTLTRYGLERLLYRLSISEHAPNFLLKGALLFQLWYGQPHRPTRDADLLGFGPDDVPTLVGVFRSICSIAVDDGIVFDPRVGHRQPDSQGRRLRRRTHRSARHPRRRAPVPADRHRLRRCRHARGAVRSRIRPCCPMFPHRRLRAYPKATVVAEKLHAVTVLGMTNSRMKDFFDLCPAVARRPRSTMRNCGAPSKRPSPAGKPPCPAHGPSV